MMQNGGFTGVPSRSFLTAPPHHHHHFTTALNLNAAMGSKTLENDDSGSHGAYPTVARRAKSHRHNASAEGARD